MRGRGIEDYLPIGFLVMLVVVLLSLWDDTPIMQLSYPEEECIAVLPSSSGSCSYPPEKYTIEWVSSHYATY